MKISNQSNMRKDEIETKNKPMRGGHLSAVDIVEQIPNLPDDTCAIHPGQNQRYRYLEKNQMGITLFNFFQTKIVAWGLETCIVRLRLRGQSQKNKQVFWQLNANQFCWAVVLALATSKRC